MNTFSKSQTTEATLLPYRFGKFGYAKFVVSSIINDILTVVKKHPIVEQRYCKHCKKYRNFTKFPGVEISWKDTVSA